MNSFSDVQVNILEGHGRNFSAIVLVKLSYPLTNDDIQNLRKWVGHMLGSVTSHEKQKKYQEIYIANGRQPTKEMVSWLAFRYPLLKKFGVHDYVPSSENIFREGMNYAGDEWHDYQVVIKKYKPQDKYLHPDPYKQGLSLMVGIAGDCKKKIIDRVEEIREYEFFKKNESDIIVEYGYKGYKNGIKPAIGPLGFADGMSNPRGRAAKLATLVDEKSRNKTSVEIIGRGSFLVFRKLRVHHCYFNMLVKKLAKEYSISVDKAEAMYMGRFKNGFPVVNYRDDVDYKGFDSNPKKDIEFSYSTDIKGLKCPLGAHIRKANPRNGNGEKGIVRRSVLYANETSFPVSRDYDKCTPLGLLFMCYQASIQEQLLPILKRMAGLEIECFSKRVRDSLMYRSDVEFTNKVVFPKEYSLNKNPEEKEFGVGGVQLTHFLGGDCFYVPSIPLLEKISKIQSGD